MGSPGAVDPGEGSADEEHGLLTPTRIRALLADHGLAPRRTDGQNFLVDPNTVRRIVAAAELAPDDRVLEIGPGLGSMTLLLAEVVAEVVAIEIDAGLVAVLREVLRGRENVTVLHADAMAVDLDEAAGGPVRLVANLPYNVATPLLLHALAAESVVDAYVMVQREVADRWAATVGDPAYGAVSVKLALAAEVTVDLSIPRTVFYPVPNVDSVMVTVVRHPSPLPPEERARVAAVIDAAFRQRRKTLRNNLRRALGDDGPAALERAGIDPGRRAETLDVADFVRLTEALGGHGGLRG